MINAKIDDNGRPTIIAVSSDDGKTIEQATANRHILKVDDNTTGTDNGGNTNAEIDANSKSTMTALSSSGDGSIVLLCIDPITKKLLINSN